MIRVTHHDKTTIDLPEDTPAIACWGLGPVNHGDPDCIEGAGLADLARPLHEQRGRAVRYVVPATGKPHPLHAGKWRWGQVETWEDEARRLRARVLELEHEAQFRADPGAVVEAFIALDISDPKVRAAIGRGGIGHGHPVGVVFDTRHVPDELPPILHPQPGAPADGYEFAAALASESRPSTISEPPPAPLIGAGPRPPLLVDTPPLLIRVHSDLAPARGPLDDGMGDPRAEMAPLLDTSVSPLAASVRRG